jgi:hypothetical protein
MSEEFTPQVALAVAQRALLFEWGRARPLRVPPRRGSLAARGRLDPTSTSGSPAPMSTGSVWPSTTQLLALAASVPRICQGTTAGGARPAAWPDLRPRGLRSGRVPRMSRTVVRPLYGDPASMAADSSAETCCRGTRLRVDWTAVSTMSVSFGLVPRQHQPSSRARTGDCDLTSGCARTGFRNGRHQDAASRARIATSPAANRGQLGQHARAVRAVRQGS